MVRRLEAEAGVVTTHPQRMKTRGSLKNSTGWTVWFRTTRKTADHKVLAVSDIHELSAGETTFGVQFGEVDHWPEGSYEEVEILPSGVL